MRGRGGAHSRRIFGLVSSRGSSLVVLLMERFFKLEVMLWVKIRGCASLAGLRGGLTELRWAMDKFWELDSGLWIGLVFGLYPSEGCVRYGLVNGPRLFVGFGDLGLSLGSVTKYCVVGPGDCNGFWFSIGCGNEAGPVLEMVKLRAVGPISAGEIKSELTTFREP